MQPVKNVELAPNDVKLLSLKGFTVGDALNSGSFACVCKATYKNVPAAVKVIDLEKTSDDYRLKFLPRELYTMKKLKHDYLIEIIDIFVIGNRVLVFMELADGGDFLDLLQKTKELSESDARRYYMQFGDALRYMHEIGFAHRDIKCENILLNKAHTTAKLTDYGFTRSCFERRSGMRQLSDTYCGSTAYVAPEVLQSTPYNPMISDVWSMGIVLYVLVQASLPFSDRDTKKLLRDQLERDYKFVKNVTKQCKDVIAAHLNPNPSTRASMLDIFQYEWFASHRKRSTDDDDD
ncbi:hypothetical protein RDWZM_004348 [Blomia tropicalis]|uniref:Protein kinase domain-containing protein n=1 Tax=Blomia tropicalis TaxID=40697 RepID=A0A9Q0RRQ5_BLOTA|nr:Kinase-like [Blomia tropicalis]KAJ6225803.1 hypothetical protein RDWZM_004348 [Blomia tropicalis]